MQKSVAVIFSVLLLISGALAAYGECFQANIHHEFGADHENAEHVDPSIHCPDALLTFSIQAVSSTRTDSRNLSKILPSIDEKLDSFILGGRFKDHPFRQPLSQQNLFRFEEVYRL